MANSELNQLRAARAALLVDLESAERGADGRDSSRVNNLRGRMDDLVGRIKLLERDP
jgi:hypothetical protein